VNQVCQQTNLSFPAAAKAIQRLESSGIVREVTGQRRNRVFVYHDYLNILNEGTEVS
jgi:ribosomal protein S25